MYKWKVILRYLRARRITVIPIAAVTVAVFLLIVVLAVMNGFSSFIQGKIRGTRSDVIVDYGDVRGFGDYGSLAARIAQVPGVAAVSPHLTGKAVLTLYAGEDDRPFDFQCIFVGIDFDAENRVSELRESLVSTKEGFTWTGGGEELPGLILGNEVLGRYKVHPGYAASLTTPTAVDYGADNAKKFRITDHFKTGLYEYDRTTVYVPLAEAQQLTRLEDRITEFHIRAEKGVDLDRLRDAVARVLPRDRPFVVKTWMEAEKVLIDAMRLERVIWVVILSALLAVAGFCILAVMSLTVIQKTRDIGILRSLGARLTGVLATFLQYGLVVGLIGSTVGLFAGVAVLSYLDPIERLSVKCIGWTPWPRDVFYFETIPRDITWSAMLTFWVGGIAVSFLASIIPSVRAARTNPVRTLRVEP